MTQLSPESALWMKVAHPNNDEGSRPEGRLPSRQ